MAGVVEPDLRTGGVDGQLAGDAGRVGVEDAGSDAPVAQQVDDELRLGEVGRGVDPLQNRTDTIALAPLSSTPERPVTRKPPTLRPIRGVIMPLTPSATVVKLVSVRIAGMS